MATTASDSFAADAAQDDDLDDDMLAAIAAAEAAVADMAGEYQGLLAADAASLAGAVGLMEANAPGTDKHAEGATEAFRCLHDIKGQGGTFGYEITTAVADILCEKLRGATEVGDGMVALIADGLVLFEDIAREGETEAVSARAQSLIEAVAQQPAA